MKKTNSKWWANVDLKEPKKHLACDHFHHIGVTVDLENEITNFYLDGILVATTPLDEEGSILFWY